MKNISRDIYLFFVVYYLAIPRDSLFIFSIVPSPRLCFSRFFNFVFHPLTKTPREMREVFGKKKKCREASEYTANLTYNSLYKNRQAHAASIYNVSIIYALPLAEQRATNG